MNIPPMRRVFNDKVPDTSILSNCSNLRHEELVNLLGALKCQAQSLADSPQKVVLDHAVQVCQSYLSNLLEIDWHKRLYDQVKSQEQGLNDQLKLVLKLLSLNDPLGQAYSVEDHVVDPGEQQSICQVRQELDDWLQMPLSEESEDTVTEKCTHQENCPFHHGADVPSTIYPKTSAGLAQSSANDCSSQLDVHFFGAFRVYRGGELIDCLSKSRAKQLLKYLILNRTKSIPKEVLMDRFWPNYDQNSARNNLNVAVYCLRQTLKSERSDIVHILFQDGCYCFNPNLQIHVDTEVFESHVKSAERFEAQHKIAEAIKEYRCAEVLYQGDFLAEDLYDDQSLELREYYKSTYVKVLGKLSDFYYQEGALEECIGINRKITSAESADEHAHRRLMECFVQLNQRHFALRQYHLCRAALAKELDLKPSKETIALYEAIKIPQYSEKAS